ncbi:polyprenyl synthetase family protein [Streptomyces sp. NPDC056835]|uniref:polyprenyl synthetase family protein n=1 Tax=Streptomyces sp. NPDC056835 TaxID=3345956 RepID=UPI00369E41A9
MESIHPLLCVTGWASITDRAPPPAVWRVAASLELFHAFALIHDDIMDKSDTRRGRPTAHRALAAHHAHHPDADALGVNTAILLGDLALGWSYELLHTNDTRLHRTWKLLNALRTETLTGQYLDLTATGDPTADVDTAWRIIRYKTAKYTIERPLHLGAAPADADPTQLRSLSAYAIPLGEAFPLRDDLLGVYGNPEQSGKSTLDDLREGKHTVLVATALDRATPAQRRTLKGLLGAPSLDQAAADTLRAVLIATGAAAAVEQMITDRLHAAQRALDGSALRPAATTALCRPAASTAVRASWQRDDGPSAIGLTSHLLRVMESPATEPTEGQTGPVAALRSLMASVQAVATPTQLSRFVEAHRKWFHDLLSYNRELLIDGTTRNIVMLLARLNNCPPEQAVHQAVALRDRLTTLFLRLREQEDPKLSAPGRAYVADLAHAIRSNLDWGSHSPRYTVVTPRTQLPPPNPAPIPLTLTDHPSDPSTEPLPHPSIAWWWQQLRT